jgi:hypothetical protein
MVCPQNRAKFGLEQAAEKLAVSWAAEKRADSWKNDLLTRSLSFSRKRTAVRDFVRRDECTADKP